MITISIVLAYAVIFILMLLFESTLKRISSLEEQIRSLQEDVTIIKDLES